MFWQEPLEVSNSESAGFSRSAKEEKGGDNGALTETGLCRIWSDSVGFGLEFGRIWSDSVGFGLGFGLGNSGAPEIPDKSVTSGMLCE